MTIQQLANANASVIAVTNTATLLSSLLDTAASASNNLPGTLNAVTLIIEDGDVRMLADGNTPTATKGILLKRGGIYSFRRIPVSQIKLIRTGSANVAVGVEVGYVDSGEVSQFGFIPYAHELLAGEDLTNDIQKVEERFSYGRVTADGQVKGVAGFLHTVTFSATGAVTAGVITIYDSLTETGTVIWSGTIQTGLNPTTITLDVSFGTGLYVGYDATIANVATTVSYR